MRFAELLDDACHRWADRIAFRVPGREETWSYERVRIESDAIGVALQREGIGRGNAVAMLSPNKPEAFIAQIGILKSGAAYVPLNAKSVLDDWTAVSKGAGATALLFGAEMALGAANLLQRNKDLTLEYSFGDVKGVTSIASLLQRHSGQTPHHIVDNREDPCWIMGSGGTTGTPKSIAIPQRALIAQTLGLYAHMPDETPRQLVSAPLTHSAGGLTFPLMLQGGESIVMDGARPGELLEAIDKYAINRLFMPPTGIYAMLAHPSVREYNYSSLRYFIYGAAPMSLTKLREAMEVFGPVMAQFYGQAEAPTICTWLSPTEHTKAVSSPDLEHRLTSCGRASAVASIRIVGGQGQDLPQGEIGEIAVKGELRFLGYMNAPAEAAKLEVEDGYVRTGDIGYIDADGFVYISDRARDMIISGGFNVFPSQVESVIWTHPSVQDCAVIGVPDETWGEAVTAVVELKDGARESPEEILSLCRERLGPVRTPKRVIFDSLPRSAVGKVLKRELREKYGIYEEKDTLVKEKR